ncbi:MAG: V-type ATP synthase subunit D [Erysipelotrichales bacterium]|nr:V-type ATP synthase subunit D [Erysipelotrichales bacterium]
MAANQVNATRMELSKLKNKLVTARRGHKLLKDKQDELVRQFLEIIQMYKALRSDAEKKLSQVVKTYELAHSSHSEIEIYEKMLVAANEIKADYSVQNIMGVSVPKISFAPSTPTLTFSLIDSDPNLDESILMLGSIFPELLNLAQVDKTCHRLAKEVEKVRRRVNAIEYFMIPELEIQIKEITGKLADAERSNIIRTMKSKEIVLKRTQKDNKDERKSD